MAFAALLTLGGVVVGLAARGTSFASDDWAFVLGRRGHSADVVLNPHNEHLSALPILIYKALLATFGASSYAPFIATALVFHAAACTVLYLIARERIGRWAALAPAAVLLLLGPAWQDLLWAFQMAYFLSVAAALGAWLLLERRGLGADIGAALCLCVCLLSSSIGVGVLVGSALLVIARREYRRLVVVAVPLALYAAWYLAYETASRSEVAAWFVVRYVFNSLAAAMASTTGLVHGLPTANEGAVPLALGRPLAVLALVGVAWMVVRRRSVAPVALAAAATCVTLWIAAGLYYLPVLRDPDSSRYQYASVAFLLVLAVDLAAGWRPSRRSAAILMAGAVCVVASNTVLLVRKAPQVRAVGRLAAAEAGALDVARPVASPTYSPVNGELLAHGGVVLSPGSTAGAYYSARDTFGSPALSAAQLRRQSSRTRAIVDLVLAQALALAPRPARGLAGVERCARQTALARRGALLAGPGVLLVRRVPSVAPARITLRRFASDEALVSWPLRPGTTSLRLPRDRSATPWRITVTAATGTAVCFRASTV